MINHHTEKRPLSIDYRYLINPIYCLALGFGSGLVPKAPGTMGTLIGLLLYIPLQTISLIAYITIVITSFLLGIFICGKTADKLGMHDHPAIVWDEIVGYWLTMLIAPSGLIWCLLGFLLFRLFDIWKPYPIRMFDQTICGGFGIMIDDLLAACYAGFVLKITDYLMQWLVI